MKIALAFFGLPRCSAVAFPSIRSALIEPLAAAGELRIFRHFWRQEWVGNARSGENLPLDPANYDPFATFEGAVEAPPQQPSSLMERLAGHGDAWQDGLQSLRNLVLQLQSLYEVTQHVARARPDLVVFTRPDLLYHQPLPESAIAHVQEHPDAVVAPCWECWGGLNDRFAICGARAWRAYGGRLLLADHYCERTGKPLHSESFLAHALAFAGVEVRTIAMRASRVRVDGRLEPEDFTGARSPLVV